MLSEMVSAALAARLAGAGRPLMLGGDVGASLRASGVSGHLGRLLREGGDEPHLHGDALARHYAVEIAAGADVLTTLTSDTTPHALARVGMAYRAASLTARAVDRALESVARAGRSVSVAGVLGPFPGVFTDDESLAHAHAEHAARLSAAGVEIIFAQGEVELAVRAGVMTDLPTWALVSTDTPEKFAELLPRLAEASAAAVIFMAPTPAVAREALVTARSLGATLPLGVVVDADTSESPEEWAHGFVDLLDLSPRAFGGGRGATYAHTTALATLVRKALPSLLPPSLGATG